MKLFWKLYAVLFLTIALEHGLELFNKGSMISIYYNTTIVFNDWYSIPYFLNLLSVSINSIAAVLILGHSFEVKGLSKVPAWLFFLRLLCDCTGHSYELKVIQSGFYQDKMGGLIGLVSLILPILPSYIAQWRMTFKK